MNENKLYEYELINKMNKKSPDIIIKKILEIDPFGRLIYSEIDLNEYQDYKDYLTENKDVIENILFKYYYFLTDTNYKNLIMEIINLH